MGIITVLIAILLPAQTPFSPTHKIPPKPKMRRTNLPAERIE
ncbi:MAG: hypothetical protein NTU53_03240 [Planctomycetota bacterium]|nr:hypothetical protein [Planctomycetota bacterium]